MNVAVYSGSFNPLHIGHLTIIKRLIYKAGFDAVYLIVSPKNPLKDNISSDSAHERYKAAEEAVARHFNSADRMVLVDDIEITMPEPHYSINTLEALQRREPDNSFTLIIGADNLADIRRWKDYGRILSEYGVAVFPREGYGLDKIKQDFLCENPAYKIRLIDAPLVTVSSTEIREARSKGEDVSHLLM